MDSSGRPNSTKLPKLDLNSEIDSITLLRSIAKSTSIVVSGPPRKGYKPLYRHPLPVSSYRCEYEEILKRVMSCPLEKQAAAAIVYRDAHTLEEVYMRGAPVDLPNRINGFTPLHLAVQANSIECVLILLHIGVNIDAVSLSGATPLYLAGATEAIDVRALLLEHGAKSEKDRKVVVHSSSILTYNPPNLRASALILAPMGSRKLTSMATRHASY